MRRKQLRGCGMFGFGNGMMFRTLGANWVIVTIGNLMGFAALIAVAYAVAWFKSQPWRQQKLNTPVTNVPQSGASTVPVGVPARRID